MIINLDDVSCLLYLLIRGTLLDHERVGREEWVDLMVTLLGLTLVRRRPRQLTLEMLMHVLAFWKPFKPFAEDFGCCWQCVQVELFRQNLFWYNSKKIQKMHFQNNSPFVFPTLLKFFREKFKNAYLNTPIPSENVSPNHILFKIR